MYEVTPCNDTVYAGTSLSVAELRPRPSAFVFALAKSSTDQTPQVETTSSTGFTPPLLNERPVLAGHGNELMSGPYQVRTDAPADFDAALRTVLLASSQPGAAIPSYF